MRQLKARWIAPAALLIVGVAVLAQIGDSQNAKIKWVTEAENCSALVAGATKIADTTASAGKAVTYPLKRPHAAEENPGIKGDGGNTTYKVNLAHDGTYRIWVLAWWFDGCGNSYFVNVDNAGTQVVGQDGTYRRWHWVQAANTYELAAGQHTIKLQDREDGARADQLLITDDLRWTPVRAMPEAGNWIR